MCLYCMACPNQHCYYVSILSCHCINTYFPIQHAFWLFAIRCFHKKWKHLLVYGHFCLYCCLNGMDQVASERNEAVLDDMPFWYTESGKAFLGSSTFGPMVKQVLSVRTIYCMMEYTDKHKYTVFMQHRITLWLRIYLPKWINATAEDDRLKNILIWINQTNAANNLLLSEQHL